MRLPILYHAGNGLFIFRRIEAGSAKDRSAARKNAVNRGTRERLDIILKQAEITVANAQYFDAVRSCATNHGAKRSVETGAVAAGS